MKTIEKLETMVTYGIVMKLPLGEIENFKQHIEDFPAKKFLIYNEISVGPLWLKEGEKP